MAKHWKEYQEETAEFFRSLGLDAQTDVRIKGVRTEHAVDVLVKSTHAGFEVTWVVECKLWNSRVTKNHVLALREIVSDTGADRGILMAENGFQRGAAEAAKLTNVHLTSLADTHREAKDEILGMRLSDLHDRVEAARERYWSIPKSVRIAHGVRPDVSEVGFSGDLVIKLAEDLLRKGFRGSYPFEPDYMWRSALTGFPETVSNAEQLCDLLDSMIGELERRLQTCPSRPE
ncbi:MAG: restriction endonuclease [Massilia sp.]